MERLTPLPLRSFPGVTARTGKVAECLHLLLFVVTKGSFSVGVSTHQNSFLGISSQEIFCSFCVCLCVCFKEKTCAKDNVSVVKTNSTVTLPAFQSKFTFSASPKVTEAEIMGEPGSQRCSSSRI